MNIDAAREGLSRASLVTTLTCAIVGTGALSTFGPGVPTASAVEINNVVTGVTMTNESSPNGPNTIWDEF